MGTDPQTSAPAPPPTPGAGAEPGRTPAASPAGVRPDHDAEVREEQAARIRWLLERAASEVYWEFTLVYVPAHPFPSDPTLQLPEDLTEDEPND
jgi:hypothetical protein